MNPVASAWRPLEFGLPRALLLSAALMAALIGAVSTWQPPHEAPAAPPPLQMQLVELPATLPFEPPPVEPVPPVPESTPEAINEADPDSTEPVAAPAPDAAATDSAVVVPERPLPPQPPPVNRPAPPRAIPRRPSPPRDTAFSMPAGPAAAPLAATSSMPAQPPAAPPIDTSSGIGPYRAGLHLQVERNIAAAADIQALAATGTATIEATIRPDGQVLSARIARSSGSRPLDHAALTAVQRGGFRPFGPHMPVGPITISVPITLTN